MAAGKKYCNRFVHLTIVKGNVDKRSLSRFPTVLKASMDPGDIYGTRKQPRKSRVP